MAGIARMVLPLQRCSGPLSVAHHPPEFGQRTLQFGHRRGSRRRLWDVENLELLELCERAHSLFGDPHLDDLKLIELLEFDELLEAAVRDGSGVESQVLQRGQPGKM